MNDLVIRAIVAGLFFGAWPLFMNRSNLSGSAASAAFALGCLVCVLPIAFHEGLGSLPKANWMMVVCAAAAGGLGLLIFNGMLSKATPHEVGTLFMVCVLAQLILPAIYEAVMTRSVHPSKVAGLVAAIVAAKLLL